MAVPRWTKHVARIRVLPSHVLTGQHWIWRLLLAVFFVIISGCNYEYVEREIGYKGRARVDPWLAAENFARRYDFPVMSLSGWRPPEQADAMWFVPAAVLSNESFARRVEEWAKGGGHLVVIVEHAAAETSDWRVFEPELPLPPALPAMLLRLGIELKPRGAEAGTEADRPVSLHFAGKEFEVAAKAGATVAVRKGVPGVFASVLAGAGRVSVLVDARPLRNRWIGEHQHAEFLLALIKSNKRGGHVVFVRNCELSLWGMMRQQLWPVLCALALLLVLWLWKNLSRFGPLEAAAAPITARGYDHHLEALGNFHWRLDCGAGLLAPLREQILERAQRLGARGGPVDDGLLQWLATRSGLPEARVAQALAPAAPSDSLGLTRCVADLQALLKILT
ncbi:MAG: DUF4350 domain-containing protein [Verrucomicrobiota bacterium]